MLTFSRSRGRHRAPTEAGRAVARVGVACLVMTAAPIATEIPAHADTLDVIEGCESSGNARATNGSHFGLYQFDLPTWRSVGGTGNPMDASRAEQRLRAEKLLLARGTQPWNASSACWSKETSAVAPGAAPSAVATTQTLRATQRARPEQAGGRHRAERAGTYTVRPGDTLGSIAEGAGTSWPQLFVSNRAVVDNPDRIFPGQQLRV